ncbi:MAG: DUF1573 domain-containing protein [Bacteroidaceae bacterium]
MRNRLMFIQVIICIFVSVIGCIDKKRDNVLTSARVICDSISLGHVKEGTKRRVPFVVENTGSEVLIVRKVRTSCECTTAEYPENEIKSKEKDTVFLIYDAKDIGAFHRTADVECNTNKSIRLTIIGFVDNK